MMMPCLSTSVWNLHLWSLVAQILWIGFQYPDFSTVMFLKGVTFFNATYFNAWKISEFGTPINFKQVE
jgi:hypothetical protein